MFSLPDWAFYPITTATAAGMIVGAMSFGESTHRTPEEIRSEGLVYDGERLASLTTGNGLTVDFLSEDGLTFARISAARGPMDGSQSAGAFFTFSPNEMEALQGRRVRLSYRMRASSENGARSVLVNLFTPDRGQSAWQELTLQQQFETYELDVESTSCEWSFGYAAIWPDWALDANQVDLSAITVTALEEVSCP